MAETEGFEPSVQMYPYDGLANRWFQPLTHVSGSQRRARPIAGVPEGGKGLWVTLRRIAPGGEGARLGAFRTRLIAGSLPRRHDLILVAAERLAHRTCEAGRMTGWVS